MTTDLTGDFELGEDEFDWDVFLPDPDDVDAEAEAAALEDDPELSRDDSDFDWDGALRDDAAPDSGADGDARSGAAYDRIVDTVRRSFGEEPSADPDPDAEPESSSLPGGHCDWRVRATVRSGAAARRGWAGCVVRRGRGARS